jgi:hypothetical protein
VEELKEAQKASRVGTAFPPGFLFTAIMTQATAWTASNPFGPSLDPSAQKQPAALRRNIAKAARLLAEARIGDT